METNGLLKQSRIKEDTIEESFEGDQLSDGNQLIGEDEGETSIEDYQEVSNENEANQSGDADGEDPFEGGDSETIV